MLIVRSIREGSGLCGGRPPAGSQNVVLTRIVCFFALAGSFLTGCRSAGTAQEQAACCQAKPQAQVVPARAESAQPPTQPEAPAAEREQVIKLFDGQNLGQWKVTDFGGQGKVCVKDGAIYMDMGSYMTGITWTGPVVRMDYEISLDAMRVQGSDFFCGLTFPVGESPCTLILGGWGGSLCGLSSIDHYDASENETTRFMKFEKDKWYHVRLRVVPNRIQAWLDEESLVDIDVTGRKIDIRPEVDLAQPLGISTWVTTGAVKNIELTKLPQQSQ